jgi:hypothetical protein
MMFNVQGTVYKRKDGTYLIDHPEHGEKVYHATAGHDPEQFAAVEDYVAAHPDRCAPSPEPTTDEEREQADFDRDPAAYIERMCDKVDALLFPRLEAGFRYKYKNKNYVIQASQMGQDNVKGFALQILMGRTTSIKWKTRENLYINLPVADFQDFAVAFGAFVESCYPPIWDAKDFMRREGAYIGESARTLAQITDAYNGAVDALALLGV